MTTDKTSKEDQSLSPRSVHSRYFHFYDHSKNSRIPSILKRKNQIRFTNPYHLEDETSTVNRIDDESRTETESQSSSLAFSASCCSPSEKILKILMPNDLDCDSMVPSSFSPPSNKFPTRRLHNEYREVSCNSTNISPRNSVRFHSKVLVMRIPSRNQYPESIKRNLWCSLSEIARSAQRNTIEFSSEGWNWRSAVEEESMYVHPKTGQYIHPVHIRRAASTTSTSPDVEKHQASTLVEAEPEAIDNKNTKSFSAHAQPAHE